MDWAFKTLTNTLAPAIFCLLEEVQEVELQ